MILPPPGWTPPAASSVTTHPGYLAIPGRCPFTGKEDREILVSEAHLEHLEQHGPEWKFFDSALVLDCVEVPAVILEGQPRGKFDHCFCYSCKPSRRWRDWQVPVPPPIQQVFLTYIYCIGNTLFALDWAWRMEDQAKPGYPWNWQKDFLREHWCPTT